MKAGSFVLLYQKSVHCITAILHGYGYWLQWYHMIHGVSNHWQLSCLFNHLFRHRSKKTSKCRVTGLCEGNLPATAGFPHKWPVTWKMIPFDDVFMMVMDINCSDITWVLWCLKLLETWLFVQHFIQDNIKENINALHYWPYVREIHWWLEVHKGPVKQKVLPF